MKVKIIAEAGVNPNVLINNSLYPIPVSDRTDNHLPLELDTFDTTNQSDVESAYTEVRSRYLGVNVYLQVY